MGRTYTVEFENVAVSAAQDFFEVNPAANKPCRILDFEIAQISDMGDAAEEGLRLQAIRLPATPTSGSGGSSATPRPCDPNDAGAGFTCEINNTTLATTTGTANKMRSMGMNNRVGYGRQEVPEALQRVENGQLWVLRLLAAPADALTMCGTITVRED